MVLNSLGQVEFTTKVNVSIGTVLSDPDEATVYNLSLKFKF